MRISQLDSLVPLGKGLLRNQLVISRTKADSLGDAIPLHIQTFSASKVIGVS